jgi:hypothetical protein
VCDVNALELSKSGHLIRLIEHVCLGPRFIGYRAEIFCVLFPPPPPFLLVITGYKIELVNDVLCGKLMDMLTQTYVELT